MVAFSDRLHSMFVLPRVGLKRLFFAIALMGVLALAIPARGSGTYVPGRKQSDFADLLLDQQLVVEGTLLSVDSAYYSLTNPRTHRPGVSDWGWKLRISASRVLVGSAPDSQVTIYTGTLGIYPPGVLVPGQKVLAWGWDEGGDGVLLGNLVAATSNDAYVGEQSAATTPWQKDRQSLNNRYSGILSTLRMRPARDSHRLFVGAPGLALLRVREIHSLESGDLFYICDSIAALAGSQFRAPRTIHVFLNNSCPSFTFPGDTLLVPGSSSITPLDTLTTLGCIETFQVRQGRSVGFNAGLTKLDKALPLSEGTIRLNSVHSRIGDAR